MSVENQSIHKAKVFSIILVVILLGVGLFDVGFSYLFKDALEKEVCDLCFELNPDYSFCDTWVPINNLDFYPTNNSSDFKNETEK